METNRGIDELVDKNPNPNFGYLRKIIILLFFKVMRNQEREKELEIEKIELNKLMEFYKQQEKQEKIDLHNKIKSHGKDLSDQIHYNSIQRNLVMIVYFI